MATTNVIKQLREDFNQYKLEHPENFEGGKIINRNLYVQWYTTKYAVKLT